MIFGKERKKRDKLKIMINVLNETYFNSYEQFVFEAKFCDDIKVKFFAVLNL